MNYLYKFVNYDDVIIYIGKTGNLKRRMQQHFLRGHLDKECYQHTAKIYYCKIDGKTNTDMMETFLINKYHPIYNTDKKFSEDIKRHKDSHIAYEEPQWERLFIDFYENDITLSNVQIMPQYYARHLSDKEKCITLLKCNIGKLMFNKGLYEHYIHIDEIDELLEYFITVHKEVMQNVDSENSNVDESIDYETASEYVAFNIDAIKTINIKYLMILAQMHLIIHIVNNTYAIIVHNEYTLKAIPQVF